MDTAGRDSLETITSSQNRMVMEDEHPPRGGEKDGLLEPEAKLQYKQGRKRRFACSPLRWVVLVLCLCNVGLLIALALVIVKNQPHKEEPPSWQPPERYTTQMFEYQDVFGGKPSPESEKQWTKLIPRGKGWVNVTSDTELPYMPGLDKSLPEQKAMVSMFHQLHCLYMARAGYWSAVSGNLDDINGIHLSHCWDYLRQAIMCAGDATLEWLQAPPDNLGSTGWGYQHQCKDYGALYGYADRHRATDNKVIHGEQGGLHHE